MTMTSSSSTRSSTSFCFIADSNKRMVPRRTLSLARMAVFMSSVIWAFKLMVCLLGKRKRPARTGPGEPDQAKACEYQYSFLGNCMLRTRL